MKFHIINFTCIGVVLFCGCASPEKSTNLRTIVKVAASNQSTLVEKVADVPTPIYSTKPIVGAAIVFQRGQQLEAVSPRGGAPTLLRKSCVTYNYATSVWNFSPDGRQLVFAAAPSDVDFFDAGTIRRYVFTANYNRRQKVVLAAYGRKSVAWGERPDEQPDFPEARFDASGRKLIVVEGQVPHTMGDPCGSWISIWDISTRKRVFDGRQLIRKSAAKGDDVLRQMYHFSAPILSPDGNDIVCLGTYREGDYEDENSTELTRVVHFDLRHKRAEVLKESSGLFLFGTGFIWHPQQKKFLFIRPTSPTNPIISLFEFDLKTHKTTRITNDIKDDFSPQWSFDGKQIYWIRGNIDAQKANSNRIWRANTNGSGATAILPQVVGATQIQFLPHLADWGRYSNVPIEPLAGADK